MIVSSEVVVRISEVIQVRQTTGANGRREGTSEAVVSNVELLQALHPRHPRRQRTLKIIVAHIKHSELIQQTNLRRQTPGEIVVHQNNLIESVTHITNARRNASTQIVISKNQYRHGRVTEIRRDTESKAVVVEEDGVKGLVEERCGNRTFKVIKPQIQVLERRQRHHHHGEGTGEAVVTNVELMKQPETTECIRNSPAEAI